MTFAGEVSIRYVQFWWLWRGDRGTPRWPYRLGPWVLTHCYLIQHIVIVAGLCSSWLHCTWTATCLPTMWSSSTSLVKLQPGMPPTGGQPHQGPMPHTGRTMNSYPIELHRTCYLTDSRTIYILLCSILYAILQPLTVTFLHSSCFPPYTK